MTGCPSSVAGASLPLATEYFRKWIFFIEHDRFSPVTYSWVRVRGELKDTQADLDATDAVMLSLGRGSGQMVDPVTQIFEEAGVDLKTTEIVINPIPVMIDLNAGENLCRPVFGSTILSGDHVSVLRESEKNGVTATIMHHGIVTEQDGHWSVIDVNDRDKVVQLVKLSDFLDERRSLWIWDYGGIDSSLRRTLAVSNAEHMLEDQENLRVAYSMIHRWTQGIALNCEDFATLCESGRCVRTPFNPSALPVRQPPKRIKL